MISVWVFKTIQNFWLKYVQFWLVLYQLTQQRGTIKRSLFIHIPMRYEVSKPTRLKWFENLIFWFSVTFSTLAFWLKPARFKHHAKLARLWNDCSTNSFQAWKLIQITKSCYCRIPRQSLPIHMVKIGFKRRAVVEFNLINFSSSACQ